MRQGGRWGQRRGIGRVGQSGQPNRARSPPEVALSAARQRVAQLEAALTALGDTGPEVTMLQTALKRAKQAAQEPPLDVQVSLCEQFVTRAQRRLTAHDEERTRLVSELEEGQSRLARLREAATAKEVPVPPCVIQPECGGHIAHLGEMVRTLQDELKATRTASCGVLPLPDSLGDLSTLIEVKTRELTHALSQHDGEKVAKLSSVLATIGNKINMVQHGATSDDSKRRVQYQSGVSDDEFTLRSAPGEGRFAPY